MWLHTDTHVLLLVSTIVLALLLSFLFGYSQVHCLTSSCFTTHVMKILPCQAVSLMPAAKSFPCLFHPHCLTKLAAKFFPCAFHPHCLTFMSTVCQSRMTSWAGNHVYKLAAFPPVQRSSYSTAPILLSPYTIYYSPIIYITYLSYLVCHQKYSASLPQLLFYIKLYQFLQVMSPGYF